MVLEVTARDGKGKEYFNKTKQWLELGIDPDRDMRYGAWQIKEIIDLTLPPLQTQREQYHVHFDNDVEEITVEAKLWYHISGKQRELVYAESKKLIF